MKLTESQKELAAQILIFLGLIIGFFLAAIALEKKYTLDDFFSVMAGVVGVLFGLCAIAAFFFIGWAKADEWTMGDKPQKTIRLGYVVKAILISLGLILMWIVSGYMPYFEDCHGGLRYC